MTTDGQLVWRWKDYEFESIDSHQELVHAYSQFRQTDGRLYIMETGHVWGNTSLTDGPPTTRENPPRSRPRVEDDRRANWRRRNSQARESTDDRDR